MRALDLAPNNKKLVVDLTLGWFLIKKGVTTPRSRDVVHTEVEIRPGNGFCVPGNKRTCIVLV